MSCDSYIISKKVLDCLHCNQSIVIGFVVNYLIRMRYCLYQTGMLFIVLNVSLVPLQLYPVNLHFFKLFCY